MCPMIEIVRVPEGEAPDWVREAWVGHVLPCDQFLGYAQSRDKGVVSLQETTRNKLSYAVPQKDALQILRNYSPNAAAWWRIHGFPKDTPGEDYFGFDEADAKVVQGVVTRQGPGVVYDDMETGRMEPWLFPSGFAGAK